MIWIPGIVIAILTFPGFVMQTVSRKFCCDLLGIPVYEARYFKGTIIHEEIVSPARAAIVAFAPFLVNTALCGVLFFPVAFSFLLGSSAVGHEGWIQSVLAWAGISIGMHALPARATINQYLENLPEPVRHGFGYFLIRAGGVFFISIDFLKRFWLDLVYALVVGMATPYLMTRLLIAL
jgi:hypothetical protein